MLKKRELYYILALLIIAVLSFWQVSLLDYCLKYDMIDCSYPWRFIVGEHLQQGMLPIWNPYQNLGYPLFADIQSGSSWYPPVWFLGYFFGYNIYVLSFEFIFHIFLAGLGMFCLGKSLGLQLKICFLIGVSYMLSGFFIGNAQHFTLIVGAVYVPFVLSGYFDLIGKGQPIHVLKTAFFFFLLASGGYATYIVITIYLLIILFASHLIVLLVQKRTRELKKFVLNNIMLIVSCLLLCCVLLFSYVDMAPEITRTKGIELSAALSNPFSPQCLLSLILPYAVIKDLDFFATDLSMTNGYLGIITLMFLLLSFFTPKNKTYFFFLILSVFSLLIAFGDVLPFRKFIYHHIPLMNMVRFPAVFRLFTIIGLIVCAGYGLNHFLDNSPKYKKHIIYISVVFIFVFLFSIVYARLQGYLEIKQFIINHAFTESNLTEQIQHIVFQSAVQIIVLCLFAAALFCIKSLNKIIFLLCVLIPLEMFLASQLNAPYTVFYPTIKQKDVYRHHKEHFVKGFPIPDKNVNVCDNTNALLSYGPFWRNLTLFHKQISNEGFTSLVLRNYFAFQNTNDGDLEKILRNPPFFLTGSIAPLDSIQLNDTAENTSIFFENDDYVVLKTHLSEHFTPGEINIKNFTPTEIDLSVKVFENQILIFLQNHYTGWHAYINNVEQKIYKANKSLISVPVPKGEHLLRFRFEKSSVVIGFYITLISLISILILIVILGVKQNYTRIKK